MEIEPDIKISLPVETRRKIVEDFKRHLKHLTIQEFPISEASDFFANSVVENPDDIMSELLIIWEKEAEARRGLEFLYFIDRTIKIISDPRDIRFANIRDKFLSTVIMKMDNVLSHIYLTINEDTMSRVFEVINIWEQNKLFDPVLTKKWKFSLKFQTEPEFTDDINEKKYLQEKIKERKDNIIPYNLVEFSNELKMLQVVGDDKHRKNVLKLEKEIIDEQIKAYKKDVEMLKNLDDMIDKINIFTKCDTASDNDLSKAYKLYNNINNNN